MAVKKEIDSSIGLDALIENGFFYLEKHQWKKSKEYFEKAIEISPRNPYPYIGKLLITHKLPTMDSLPDCPIDFRNTNNFKTAWRYADESLKTKLQGYIEQYDVKFEKLYLETCNELSNAQSIEDYRKCYKTFTEYGNYKDSLKFARKAKEFIIQYDYEYCVEKMNQNLTEDEYLQIYNTLSDMDYKDSKKYAAISKDKYSALKCQREEEERKCQIYSSAKFKLGYAKSAKDYIEVKELLSSIAGYKDSSKMIEQCDAEMDKRKVSLFFNNLWNNTTALIVATVLAFIPPFIFLDSTYAWATIIVEAIGAAIGFNVTKEEGNKKAAAKGMFVGAAIVCVFCIALFALIGGLDGLFDYDTGDYCGICGGSGVFQGKICKYCGGWGTK